MKEVVVIGAGAAGLMAAYAAAENGHSVTVIEKNEKAGKKIYITGKGRCNLTNDIEPSDFFGNVVSNPKFLYSSVYAMPPRSVMRFFESGGLALKTERGGRVFPLSDKASDVTACLLNYCKNTGVRFKFNEKVLKICHDHSTLSGIITDKSQYAADCLVVATGGLSYPGTGSTGDGYLFAESVGHTIIQPRPALCGIVCDMSALSSLQGLSLKNVRVSADCNGTRIASFFGEMIFTHFGISGPIVLSLSSAVNRLPVRSVSISIDLKPALDEEILDKRLLRDFSKFQNRQIQNALDELLPKKMILPVLDAAGINLYTPVHSLKSGQRADLVKALKAFPVKPLSLRSIEEGIVTAGGVDVKEIDPKTMESKKVKGLYFCGEVLDVDAYTGGYNLQIAFSTGYAAGHSIK